jgi:ribosomal protein S18 acetylase RimI-like enzyme
LRVKYTANDRLKRKTHLTILYSQDCGVVDWAELKDDLIQDEFHNNRSTAQLKTSFANSFIGVFAMDDNRCIGTARALSDGICNCYVVDVWTQSEYRSQGIASRMMKIIIDAVPGQHVYLQTDDAVAFYEKLGFQRQPEGLFRISGQWLNHKRR